MVILHSVILNTRLSILLLLVHLYGVSHGLTHLLFNMMVLILLIIQLWSKLRWFFWKSMTITTNRRCLLHIAHNSKSQRRYFQKYKVPRSLHTRAVKNVHRRETPLQVQHMTYTSTQALQLMSS